MDLLLAMCIIAIGPMHLRHCTQSLLFFFFFFFV